MSFNYSNWMRSSANLATISVFLLGTLLAFGGMLWDFKRTHTEYAAEIFKEIAATAIEIEITLNNLNSNGFNDCSPKTLLAMRQALFVANSIKDIGFLKNFELVCTTGLGVLETPYPSSLPNFVTEKGFELWVDQPLVMFDKQYNALIAKKDNFNAVYDLAVIAAIAPENFRWQLIYHGNNKPNHLAGEDGLYQNKHGLKGFDFSLITQYSEHCIPQSSNYCVALASKYQTFFSIYSKLMLISFFLILIVSFRVHTFVLMAYKKFYSTRAIVTRGIRKDQFFSLYQPIVDLNSGEIIGCEALARFKDRRMAIYPDQFIPVVRELELSWLFTEQIIKKALLDLGAQSELPANFKINFNLFPSDISSGRIQKVMDIHEVKNSRFNIEFEITEDEKLEESEAISQLAWLKDQGFTIAVDDFGTGYSSLNQVKSMHCNVLKIDRSFVMDMEEGSIKSSLIPHIIKIANDLNLKVVAEGIENVMQENELRELGVEFGQGWGFGKPMTAKDLAELCKTKHNVND